METDSEIEVDVPSLALWTPQPGTCKYILDDGPWHATPPQWCGKRLKKGSAYCPAHHQRCYQYGK